jgi:hypothetical protein
MPAPAPHHRNMDLLSQTRVRCSMDELLGGLDDDQIESLLVDLNNTLDTNVQVSRGIDFFEKPSKHAPLPFPALRQIQNHHSSKRISSAPEPAKAVPPPPRSTPLDDDCAPPQFTFTNATTTAPRLTVSITPQPVDDFQRPTTATTPSPSSTQSSRSRSYKRISRPISALDLRALSAAYMFDLDPSPLRASTPSLLLGGSRDRDHYDDLASAVFGRERAHPYNAVGSIMETLRI